MHQQLPVAKKPAPGSRADKKGKEVGSPDIFHRFHYMLNVIKYQQQMEICPHSYCASSGRCAWIIPFFPCILYEHAQILPQSAHNCILWKERCRDNRR